MRQQKGYLGGEHKNWTNHQLFSLLIACTTKGSTVIDQDTAALPEPPPSAAADCPEDAENAVMTSHGCVLGTTSLGLEYFLNIPYAEPPVDELRWKRPVSAKVWETAAG